MVENGCPFLVSTCVGFLAHAAKVLQKVLPNGSHLPGGTYTRFPAMVAKVLSVSPKLSLLGSSWSFFP